MKNIIKNSHVKTIMLCIMCVITSCDLSLRDDFIFDDELDPVFEFKMTAWEWVQTRTTPDITLASQANGEEFDYMIEAIKKADMIDEYNQMTTTQRTYLMLNNNAFRGGNNIIQVVTGSSAIGATETVADVLADANVTKLRNLLKYHIVTTNITQRDPLINYGVDYQFQTLTSGEEGVIFFTRNERLAITINASPNLPSTKRQVVVRNHNYIFNNGIGHINSSYTRNVPF